MKKKEYAIWLISHKARINRALDAYCETLLLRQSAQTIAMRFGKLLDVIDETDQLGASPKSH